MDCVNDIDDFDGKIRNFVLKSVRGRKFGRHLWVHDLWLTMKGRIK